MSSITTLARPYAKAAFNLAKESSELARWQDMLALASELAQQEAIDAVLANPLVSGRQGADLMAAAAGEAFDQRFRAFLDVLSQNRRLQLLPEIARLYQELKEEAERRLRVRVVSAVPLAPDQASRMSEALSRRFDCAIELESEIDTGLIGGAVIYAGDEVIDGSLRERLNKLSAALAH